MVFAFLRKYCLYEHHNTTNNFLRATFSSVCKKTFSSSPELLKKFLTTFWTTKTGCEMTSRLIRWLLAIDRWRNNVPVHCKSRDCERFAGLCNVTVVLSISMIILHSACNSLYGSSSDKNPTYTSYKIICQKKCSYRLGLGRRKMLSMTTKQMIRENGETVSVIKAQVTICPYMNFPERIVLTRFTARVIANWEVLL